MSVSKKILVIQGHPDSAKAHLCHALADAYSEGAKSAGHAVRVIDVARKEFSWLRTQEEFYGEIPAEIQDSIEDLRWADHLLIVYPLWLGTMPALLKAFIEQVFRPGVALGDAEGDKGWPKPLLKGRSCRVVICPGQS